MQLDLVVLAVAEGVQFLMRSFLFLVPAGMPGKSETWQGQAPAFCNEDKVALFRSESAPQPEFAHTWDKENGLAEKWTQTPA